MNNLICISGTSGVGKTTVANLLACVLENNSSIIVGGDDCHKWERNNEMWKKFTHLNPEANNIELEFENLLKLKNNQSILRKKYNHHSGFFDDPIIIEPKKNIIYEGLHSLYSENIRDICDLKIYIDTDEELKIAWKINRDINKRGYSEKQVIETIQRRLSDEQKFINHQKDYADVIVRFVFHGISVGLEYEIKNPKYENLFEQVKHFYNLKKEFIDTCSLLSENEQLVQNKGGNVSFKYKDKIMITSSGVNLKNISMFEGLCVRSLNGNYFSFQDGRPSLEIDSHLYLKDAVIHAHPKHILTFLCCENSKEKLEEIFPSHKFHYIKYVAPGKKLAEEIKQCKENIIFCQNHGVFITGSSLKESFFLLKELEKIAESKIEKPTNSNIPTRIGSLFPDNVILPEKNQETNKILYDNIVNNLLIPRFLTEEEENELLNMEEEKYRRQQ